MGENLYKKIQGKLDKVNPNVKYKDVLDDNGESLRDKFNRLNHIFLDFIDNSVAKTRLQLPIEKRRKGLYVSYINSSGTPITEQYIGEDCKDSYFALNKNWSRLDSIKVDSNGKILSSYLPSYVDDVLEYDSLDGFPEIGESGKIYVTLDTDLTYRWSGSKYTEISKSLALGETETTAFPGNRGVKLESDVLNIKNNITNINSELNDINTNLNNSGNIPLIYLGEGCTEEELNITRNVVKKILNNNSYPWNALYQYIDIYVVYRQIDTNKNRIHTNYLLCECDTNNAGIEYLLVKIPIAYNSRYVTLYEIYKQTGKIVKAENPSADTWKLPLFIKDVGPSKSSKMTSSAQSLGYFNIICGRSLNQINFTITQDSLLINELNYSSYIGRYSNIENAPIFTYTSHSTEDNQYAGWLINRFTIPENERKEYTGFALSCPDDDNHLRTALMGSDGQLKEYKKLAYIDDLDTAMTIRSLDIEDEE